MSVPVMKMISGNSVSDLRLGCRFLTESKIIKYTKIIKSLLGEGDSGRSGFYGASNFGYDGVP